MIYITGDTHRDFTRFNSRNMKRFETTTKDDYVIICGDFGGVWTGDKDDEYWLDWLESKSFTTLFVDGNHENFNKLYSYPVKEWNGGTVHVIREHVLHLMRGQVFNIDGKSFFTFGGAASHDVDDGILELTDPEFRSKKHWLDLTGGMYRIKDVSWWIQEMPSESEYYTAISNLKVVNWEVDYVLTHCMPTGVQKVINETFESDELTDFLDGISKKLMFKHWFGGHYHKDMGVGQNYSLLYKDILGIV